MEKKQKDKLHHRICKAITNSGDHCKRPALTGSDYCSSHRHIEFPKLVKHGQRRNVIVAIIIAAVTVYAGWHFTKYVKPNYVSETERDFYGPKNASEVLGKKAQRKAKEAFAAIETSDFGKAESLYTALSVLYPNEPMFHYNLGVIYLNTDESELAVERFLKAVYLDSSDFQIWNNLGGAFLRVDKPLDAIKAYRKAIEIMPNEAIPYANLGWAYHKTDRLHASANEYRTAISIRPNLTQAYIGLGVTLILMKSPESAIDTLKLVFECKASETLEAAAHFYLGNAYRALGKLDSALTQWSACLAIDSNHYAAGTNYSLTLIDLQEYDTAVEYLTQLKAKYPDSVQVYINLGLAEEKRGNRNSAAALFREAIDLDPNLPEAYNNLGLTLAKMDSCGQAISYFNKAIDLKHDFINAIFNLGSANVQCGNLQRALAVWGAMFRLDMSDSLRSELERDVSTTLGFEK